MFVIRTVKDRIAKPILLGFTLLAFSPQSQAQNVPTVKWDWVQGKMSQETDTVYVINFWATWCRPCVEEMPDLLKAEKAFKGQPVRFFFVSLDFKGDSEKRVTPFAKKRRMANVVLLDEPDYNKWIPKVDKKWEGNIPVTLFLRNGQKKRILIPRELKQGEAENTVRALLQTNG